MINRIEEIKKKGFNMTNSEDTFREEEFIGNNFIPTDFSKIRIGTQTLDDANIELGYFNKVDKSLSNKHKILEAIHNHDYKKMREISNFFYETSGIYSRLCRYMAYLYRYDWMVTPYINSNKMADNILKDFNNILLKLDNFGLKKFFGEVALKVIREGCYYGYLLENDSKVSIQDLPVNYCRSRFSVNGKPAIEFNMKFFDDYYKDTNQKIRVLNLFPLEIRKGYRAYKEGKLKPDFAGDTMGWYLLDIKNTIKFNINDTDYPAFISVIPAIINLDEAQELDRKKMLQQLLKIIIQKMPLDKNGDLVFDVDEAAQLHNNAVKMLGRAIGVDVLTTFADVDVADMSDRNTNSATDDLERVERAVFNEAGVSQMQFNTDGNIALEKSILNDEASMYNLILQFEEFINYCFLAKFNKQPKKVYYRAQILTTTIYNYKEMAKLYKEQTQLGYSKMLPQIALGQSQSSVLANAYFENDILDLVHVFVPPLMSSTMNADALSIMGNDNKGGRPTNESQGNSVSEKTIQNEEAKS